MVTRRAIKELGLAISRLPAEGISREDVVGMVLDVWERMGARINAEKFRQTCRRRK